MMIFKTIIVHKHKSEAPKETELNTEKIKITFSVLHISLQKFKLSFQYMKLLMFQVKGK